MEETEVNSSITCADFPHLCRICLSNRNLKLFYNSNLLGLFRNITDIQIDPNDNLPQNVCIACINQLESISIFINLSKSTEAKLKQIILQNKMKPSIEELVSDVPEDPPEIHDDYKIKIEILDDNISVEHKPSLGNATDDSDVPKHSIKRNERLIKHSTKRHPSKCNICGEYFSSKRKLIEHQKKSASCRVRQYKCMNCEKGFFTKLQLNIHMRSHTKETPFECKICLKKFSYYPNLKKHDDVVHKGLKPFKCDVCGKEFPTFLKRAEHLRTHTGERPHICTYCGIGFKQYSTRYAHEIRHKLKNGEIPKSEKKPKKCPRKKPEDLSELECNICKKIFSSKRALFVHTQSHIGEKSFLCSVCGKGFLRKSYLEVHMRIHTGEKPYECSDCGKRFRQSGCYRAHLLIHKGERLYKCEVCQKTFIQLGTFQGHLRTHTGEKPYKCTFCGKSFAGSGNLKVHTRIHTGERPYSCSVCDMGFYTSSALKKHKKSHGSIDETESNFASE